MIDHNDPFKAAQEKKWLNDKQIARNITQEILKFGVSQTQIRNIIFLLSLELESLSDMKAIAVILNDDNKNEENTILIPGENNE
jgi:hypothetical protein